jgi:hypothetical protein
MYYHTDTGIQVVGLERYEDDLREARVRLMLEQAGISRPDIATRLELWIGDRMIAMGQSLKRRHQTDGASIASPLTVIR